MAAFRHTPAPRIPLKGPEAQDAMRRAGRIVALALQQVGEAIRPGISTAELDAIAHRTITGAGAVPAFLGYQVGARTYPATACISLNEEVVHGIPGTRTLREGDLVSVDLGAVLEGWNADAAFTFAVGDVSDLARRLMTAGQEGLSAGIAAATVGRRVRDIGAAVEAVVKSYGFSIVRDLCGHGVGQRLHEPPQIPNYASRGGDADVVLQPGMTLAIEPMVNAGRSDVRMLIDGWTFVTADAALSVHYEHTVLVRTEGPEILTVLG